MKNIWIMSVFCFGMMSFSFGNTSNNSSEVIFGKCTDNLNQFCLYGYTNSYIDAALTDTIISEAETFDGFDRKIFLRLLKERTNEIKKQKDHLNAIRAYKRSQYHLYKISVFGQLTGPVNTDLNYHQMQFQRFEGVGIRLRF